MLLMIHAESHFHVGVFSGWNRKKLALSGDEKAAYDTKTATEKAEFDKYSVQHSLISGLEFGYSFDIKNSGVFIAPTLSLAYMQKKTTGLIPIKIEISQNVLTVTSVKDPIFHIMPIHVLAKIGYNMKQFSVYGILGAGTTLHGSNIENSDSNWVGSAICGAGSSLKILKGRASVFMQLHTPKRVGYICPLTTMLLFLVYNSISDNLVSESKYALDLSL